MMWRSIIRALALIVVLGGFGHSGAWFAPAADPDDRWRAHDPAATIRPDNDAWAVLLSRRLSVDSQGVARFDYAGVTPAERRSLEEQIARWESWPVSQASRPEQLAFWINLYNAVTVRVVLDHAPVESIQDIDLSDGWFSSGPWDAPLATVEGVAVSLNDMEHRILRPLWSDPRIHYALNCASVGCPNLRPDPWTGEGLEASLEAAARLYVNHPRGVRLEGESVVVSRIYAWFVGDFGGDEAGVLAHLARYAGPVLRGRLMEIAKIHATAYDWSLNGQEATP